jgi:hypothetical protein
MLFADTLFFKKITFTFTCIYLSPYLNQGGKREEGKKVDRKSE